MATATSAHSAARSNPFPNLKQESFQVKLIHSCLVAAYLLATGWYTAASAQTPRRIPLSNVLPPLQISHDENREAGNPQQLPIVVLPFEEHCRVSVSSPEGTVLAVTNHERTIKTLTDDGQVYSLSAEGVWMNESAISSGSERFSPATQLAFHLNQAQRPADSVLQSRISINGVAAGYLATSAGLLPLNGNGISVEALPVRGVNDVLIDSAGTIWVATMQGLFTKRTDSDWQHLTGSDGLPVEQTTCLCEDVRRGIWIGTTHGVILYQPTAESRRWYYRAGPRYLPHDHVLDLAIDEDGSVLRVLTKDRLSGIEMRTTTLLEKAHTIGERVNTRHRRLGLVAECKFTMQTGTEEHTISPGANDGLWTAYHVAAMSLCHAVTGSEQSKASAVQSMESLYLLQNATGIPGLPARSVLPASAGQPDEDWRLTPDGRYWWYTDTSSDEIDGHFLAFFTFWEHIAKHDSKLRDRHSEQVRLLTDYIVDNGYQLLDWDGKRTRWGFWDPASLNDDPMHYLENGLYSLQILSFLKVAAEITGDAKYSQHFHKLINDHGYLNNVLLEKKVFPDMVNHSDDQLAYVAWYPILQLEKDPEIREALQRAVRRHYLVEEPERASFFFFVTATIDPDVVDLPAAVTNLRNIPTDRRNWRMINSHRRDIAFAPRNSRFNRPQLTRVLPADERHFDHWNDNPYLADHGADGLTEDSGSAFLLAYWMGRYHGLITEENH